MTRFYFQFYSPLGKNGWIYTNNFRWTKMERKSSNFKFHCQLLNNIQHLDQSFLPEGPVMLAVGLDMPKIETKTLGDVEHVAEVQTYGVEKYRSHADFIQGPHIMTTA